MARILHTEQFTVSLNEKQQVSSWDNDPGIIYRYSDSIVYEWYLDGNLHRENDLPAVIVYDRLSKNIITKKWYWCGEIHRDDDKPAIIDKSYLAWAVNGQLHRDHDKPAYIEINTGVRKWVIHGKLQMNPIIRQLCTVECPPDECCPITHEPYQDAVALPCNHVFERTAIADWFNRETLTCPLCRTDVKHTT